MKKLLVIIALTALCVGCRMPQPKPIETTSDKAVTEWSKLTNMHQYRVVTIDGHDYLLVKELHHYSIAIVHSESCKCKQDK